MDVKEHFEKYGYAIVKNMLSSEEALEAAKQLKNIEKKGIFDGQVENATSFPKNQICNDLQYKCLPIVEKLTGLKLFKTYTFARIYKKNSILRTHKDRPACEISISLDLGGDPWSLWLIDYEENGIEAKLEPGDGLLYRGCDLYHWRARFLKEEKTQVFMHYVDQNGPNAWAKGDLGQVS